MKWFVRDLGCNSKDVQILLTYDRFTVEQYAWASRGSSSPYYYATIKKYFKHQSL
jgi:hypothetical protein